MKLHFLLSDSAPLQVRPLNQSSAKSKLNPGLARCFTKLLELHDWELLSVLANCALITHESSFSTPPTDTRASLASGKLFPTFSRECSVRIWASILVVFFEQMLSDAKHSVLAVALSPEQAGCRAGMGFDPSEAQGQPCIPREIPGAGKGKLARDVSSLLYTT